MLAYSTVHNFNTQHMHVYRAISLRNRPEIIPPYNSYCGYLALFHIIRVSSALYILHVTHTNTYRV